jgi:hypothetical protein
MSNKPNLSNIALGFRSGFPKLTEFSQKIDFGKYKGMTVEEVIDIDPGYILWMSDNKRAKISENILDAAQEAETSERFDAPYDGAWLGRNVWELGDDE